MTDGPAPETPGETLAPYLAKIEEAQTILDTLNRDPKTSPLKLLAPAGRVIARQHDALQKALGILEGGVLLTPVEAARAAEGIRARWNPEYADGITELLAKLEPDNHA